MSYSGLFIQGAMFYLVYKSGWTLWRGIFFVATQVLLYYQCKRYALFLATFLEESNPEQMVIIAYSFQIAIVILFFCVTKRWTRLDIPWLRHLGNLTYPLYLIHEKWGLTILNYCIPDMPPLLASLLVALFLMIVSWQIFTFFESKVGPPLRRYFKAKVVGSSTPIEQSETLLMIRPARRLSAYLISVSGVSSDPVMGNRKAAIEDVTF